MTDKSKPNIGSRAPGSLKTRFGYTPIMRVVEPSGRKRTVRLGKTGTAFPTRAEAVAFAEREIIALRMEHEKRVLADIERKSRIR